MRELLLFLRVVAVLFPLPTWEMRRVSQRLVIPCLTLILLGGASIARADDLYESWPPQLYTVPIGQGQLQDFTVPSGFVGKLYLEVNGGDGGRSKIAWTTSNDVASVGASGPGARVLAEFDIGSDPGQIPPGSIIRFIIGRQGESATDLGATYGDVIASGGGGGSAVYVSVPGSPDVCDANSEIAGTACTEDFQCGMGECRDSGTQFPHSCSPDNPCAGGGTCTPVSQCGASWKLLIGAGGGGGGFAGLFDYGIFPLPISSDGRYGRFPDDGEGDARNGGDGGGSFLDSGDGGVYLIGTGGLGGGRGTVNGGAGGGGTAGGGAGIFYPGGGRANPDQVSTVASTSSADGGSGWGGGGWGREYSGGGGGGLSGGGGGGFHGGGGGGGSYCSGEFSQTFCGILFRAPRSEERLPLDGKAAYALSPDQATTVWTVNTRIPINQTILSTETWLIEPGVVLTLEPGATLTIKPGGTLINSGTLLNRGRIVNVGDITNNPSGLINTVSQGHITNTGTIENYGDVYSCLRPIDGSAPTVNPAVNGCLLTPRVSSSSPGGKEACENVLGGTWVDLDTCRIGNYQLMPGLTLDIASGMNLILEGRLTNQGTINNLGVIDNSAGVLNDCSGDYSGADPTPDPSHDCVRSPDAAFCEDELQGSWYDPGSNCTISSHTVNAGETRHLPAGFVLYITGTLYNSGTIENHATIYNQSGIQNGPDALFNNYGSVFGVLDNDSSVFLNEGSVENYGTIDIDPGGAAFDNADLGYLTHRCGSVYTGAAPINSDHGGVINGCVTAESLLCTDELEGHWDQFSKLCTIIDYAVESGHILTIPPGFTLLVTGTLFNLSIIENNGTLTVRDLIVNGEGAVLNNYGSIFTDLVFDGEATIYNRGSVDNYGSMNIAAGGGVFDNDELGVLTHKCGGGYTGAAPINSSHGGVLDETADGTSCEDGDLCTQSETCQSGVCTGGTPIVCVASDQCHEAGTCDPASGTCSNPPRPDGCAYLLGGPGASLTLASSDWSWEGGAWMAGYRAAIEDSLNFGADGVVALAIATTDLSSVSAETLALLDGFIVPQWADLETAPADATAVVDFFLGGGDLILLQEDADHDAIGQELGIPTSPSDGSVSNGGMPLFDGPFGTASDVLQMSVTGQISPTDVASHGGTVAATNGNGEVTAALWNRGDYAPGAGQLLIIADVDMWATTTASYDPLDDNGTFALNGTASVIPEPKRLWLQLVALAAIGLVVSARARRRTVNG